MVTGTTGMDIMDMVMLQLQNKCENKREVIMRGIYYFIILFGVNILSVSAQTEQDYLRYVNLRERSLQTGDNQCYWTVSLSGGGTLYQGEWDGKMNKLDFITPYGKLSVARWFSSVWGIRVQVDGGLQKNGAVKVREEESNGEFYFVDGYIGVITNIMNWGTYKRANRPLSICLYLEGGTAWTPSRKEVPAQISPAMLLGAQMNVRLTDYWSLALEIDGTIVKDNFNSYTGGRKFEGYAGATLGLVYRFSGKVIR